MPAEEVDRVGAGRLFALAGVANEDIGIEQQGEKSERAIRHGRFHKGAVEAFAKILPLEEVASGEGDGRRSAAGQNHEGRRLAFGGGGLACGGLLLSGDSRHGLKRGGLPARAQDPGDHRFTNRGRAFGRLDFGMPDLSLLRVLSFPRLLFWFLGFSLSSATVEAQRMRTPRFQEPAGELPYRAETVRFANASAHLELAGTLTLPPGPGPHPGVILVTGQGRQDRDETILGHKPYLVLADRLSRRGFVVLRYDDRGVGESTGDFSAATTPDFASDAVAAFSYLASRPEVDARRVGLLGHSEGGLMVALAARELDTQVAFLVLLASPGLPGAEFYLEQDATEARRRGLEETAIERRRIRKRGIFDVLLSEPDQERAKEKLRATMRAMELTPEERAEIAASGASFDALIDQQIEQLNTPWHRFFLGYDPATTLGQLRMPVLALVGSRDVQVPPATSLPAISKALKEGACPRYETRELPGLNHLLQTCETGLTDEYAGIEETISPVALDAIGEWVVRETRRPNQMGRGVVR